jgi:hypothetical protein
MPALKSFDSTDRFIHDIANPATLRPGYNSGTQTVHATRWVRSGVYQRNLLDTRGNKFLELVKR